jgi:hypothetical protein
MTDEAGPKLVYLGTYEAGANAVTISAAALAQVEQRIAAERAEAEKARLAQVADGERVRNTARARSTRHLRRALKALTRMK